MSSIKRYALLALTLSLSIPTTLLLASSASEYSEATSQQLTAENLKTLAAVATIMDNAKLHPTTNLTRLFGYAYDKNHAVPSEALRDGVSDAQVILAEHFDSNTEELATISKELSQIYKGAVPGSKDTTPTINTNLGKDAIRTENIKNYAVTGIKIANNTITTANLDPSVLANLGGTNAATANTLVKRDKNADFSARNITANQFIGNLNGNIIGSPNFSGNVKFAKNVTVAGTLGVSDATQLNNNLTVTGRTLLNNNLTVTGFARLTGQGTSLFVKNDAKIDGSLTVAGSSTLSGATSVGGDFRVNSPRNLTVEDGDVDFSSGKFHFDHNSGNLSGQGVSNTFTGTMNLVGQGTALELSRGNLIVAGTATLSGNTSVGGTLDVTSDTTLNADFVVSDGECKAFSVYNTCEGYRTKVHTPFHVCGNSTFCSDVNIDGSTTATDVTVSGDFTVTGTTDINTTGSAATTIGNCETTTHIRGDINLHGTTDINTCGSAITTIGNNSSSTSVGGNLGVTGAATLSDTLTVDGNAIFNADLTVSDGYGYCEPFSVYSTCEGYRTSINTPLHVSGATTICDDLSVTGLASFLRRIALADEQENTVIGTGAGTDFSGTSATNNTLFGFDAGASITTGDNNVAVGHQAGNNFTRGSNNICLGSGAGSSLDSCNNNNICIGNAGVNGDDGHIRIGTTEIHDKCYIAGIYNTAICSGASVEVNCSNQLGITVSSARYKTDIKDLGSVADDVLKLRPVSFTYKSDDSKTLQYGLIAEEVEKVLPQLVIYNEAQQPETVRYQLIPSLLLEVNKRQESRINSLEEKFKMLQEQIALINS